MFLFPVLNSRQLNGVSCPGHGGEVKNPYYSCWEWNYSRKSY